MAKPSASLVELARRIAKGLADNGTIIASGWAIYRAIALERIAPLTIAEDDRLHEAYNAGAIHLFTTLMAGLDPGDGETAQDLVRMDKLYEEVKKIDTLLRAKYGIEWHGGDAL